MFGTARRVFFHEFCPCGKQREIKGRPKGKVIHVNPCRSGWRVSLMRFRTADLKVYYHVVLAIDGKGGIIGLQGDCTLTHLPNKTFSR
jgi:hypothetical protein